MGSVISPVLPDTHIGIMHALWISLVVACVTGIPTLYKVDSQKKTAERVMVAVSSTVIPLEDLPEQEVGFGFGFSKEDKGKKPAYLKDIKLITRTSTGSWPRLESSNLPRNNGRHSVTVWLH